jgi:ATP-binding cassette subfamily C (CFTR/MRP) protein 1
MDIFCDTVFWDSNITWESGILELTPCFQQTVLAWFPHLFLWIFCGVDVHYIKTSRYRDIQWNSFNISKIVIIVILVCLALFELIVNVVADSFLVVDVLNPIIKIISYVSI